MRSRVRANRRERRERPAGLNSSLDLEGGLVVAVVVPAKNELGGIDVASERQGS
jgi:hypothetical protein